MKLKEMPREIKLHGIKCYNILARGIKHMAYSHRIRKLAVLRNDFSIEIWNFSHAPFIERVIAGSVECAIEQLCWVNERLFSVSISGAGLIEWDIKTLTKRRRMLLTGDKGICIDYHKKTQRIAIGTEEGFINIFDVSDDDLQYVKVLDRQDHRIVCCKFSDAGDYLVSGSTDAVKVWSVGTGHVVHKMSTGRSEQNQETTVWCVEVLKDFTIVTGDSRGRLTFWDGNVGSQNDWIQASNADIMCLTVSEDQNSIYCSGIEQVVRKYVRIEISREGQKFDQWIRNAKRLKLHTHDVLAITTLSDNQIASGGIDGFLSLSSDELKVIERIGPFLKHSFAETAEEARMMLMMYTNYLEIWKLAKAKSELTNIHQHDDNAAASDDNDSDPSRELRSVERKENRQYYKMSEFPEKLLELRSKGDEMIVCASVSNDGKWIAYSTSTAVRLFHFEIENHKAHLMRVKNIPDELNNCTKLIFAKDSSSLIAVDLQRVCKIFDLSSGLIEHRQTIDLNEYHSDLIHLVTISKCSKYLVFGSLCNNISVWVLKKKKYEHLKSLPKHSCPPTAMKINDNQPILLIAYANNRITEFNLTELHIQFSPCLSQIAARFAIMNVCYDAQDSGALIFLQNNSINVIKKGGVTEQSKQIAKKAKSMKEGADFTQKLVKKFETYLIHMEWLGDSELLVLEMNPVALMENLPAPLRRKVFGAM